MNPGRSDHTDKEDGKGKSVKKIKALTVKLETVTLIGRGGQNPTWYAH